MSGVDGWCMIIMKYELEGMNGRWSVAAFLGFHSGIVSMGFSTSFYLSFFRSSFFMLDIRYLVVMDGWISQCGGRRQDRASKNSSHLCRESQ